MIVVIADDYTGAAEIAGLGWRHGLRAEVRTGGTPTGTAELVVIDTDTRALPPPQAARVVKGMGPELRELPLAWLFKKVDSVLRGPVAAEVAALLEAGEYRRCLLVAGNPQAGRTIRGGRYTIHGQPLAETDFARDPEHPARSSRVRELLGESALPVVSLPVGRPLPEEGIAVAEVASERDLAAWASRVEASTLPAGGGAFFAALLAARGHRRQEREAINLPPGPALLLCGSQSAQTQSFLAEAEAAGLPVVYMPPALIAGQSQEVSAWAQPACRELEKRGHVVMAIRLEGPPSPGQPQRLCRLAARAVTLMLREVQIAHLLLEGGATASAVVRALGWQEAMVVCEWAQGVTTMRPAGSGTPLLTTKPGSYPWPEMVSTVLPRLRLERQGPPEKRVI